MQQVWVSSGRAPRWRPIVADSTWRDALEALAGVLVLLLFAVGFWLWASILVAVQ